MSCRHEVATDLSPGLQPGFSPGFGHADQGVAREMARPDSVALSGHAPIQPGTQG
jgi:hypothetical protein